jgi:uncharacterized phage protein gp47/JayE
MPFSRPTLKTLLDRAIADINARLPEGDARLSSNVLNVLAFVNGGAVNGLYGYLDWLAKQLMPDTAEKEYLDRWATTWKVPRKAGSPAVGNAVTFNGTDGITIPAGTSLQRTDGQKYLTTADATIVAGTASAPVVAEVVGSAGNTAVGVTLNLVSPIAGISSTATVADIGITTGSDEEKDEALRARLLARIQESPKGGAADDYVSWALEVAGVTRAWRYPGELGAGTVTVRFVRDNDVGGIIPDATAVAAVQSYLDARRPVTADLTVVAPVAAPIDFQIQALNPSSASVKAAVQAELSDLLMREAIPGGTILLSHIRAAISAAAGESDHVLVAPNANVVNATGYISTMGVMTWL